MNVSQRNVPRPRTLRARRIAIAIVLAIAAWLLVANAASAQDAGAPPKGLPTAPGAGKAVEGGASQAPASLPGYGASPLEPYLIAWLLPVSGIACAAIGVGIDRRLRASGGR